MIDAPDSNAPLIQGILNAGAIAGLISIFLEIHQGRRNRPAFAYTFEGYQTVDFRMAQHPHYCDARFQGLIRNTSLNPNTIARIFLVVWDDNKLNHPKRLGTGVKSVLNRATDEPLPLPLRMEARDALSVEIIFDLRLTDSNGKPSYDGQLLLSAADNRPDHVMLFEDAAGNYFDQAGRMLSRTLMDLYSTLPNSRTWRQRLDHYNRIASSWVLWKLAIFRSCFGFYK